MMSAHLEEAMQRGMDEIRNCLTEMAGLVVRSLEDSVHAFDSRDRQLSYAVILRDRRIDALEKRIDRLALEFLVRQQPVAGPLRFAYVAIKVNQELERIGDYAESICRQVLKLHGRDLPVEPGLFREIARLAIPMVSEAVRAFLGQDSALARETMRVEDVVNALRDRLTGELVDLNRSGTLSIEVLLPLLTIVRRLERVSDQAKNMCEEVLYMCTGEYAKHAKPDTYRILFVDGDRPGLSLLAEAVGRSLDLRRFEFGSASLGDGPVDPAISAYLDARGLSGPGLRSRAVGAIPDAAQWQVWIALCPEAAAAFPAPPGKSVCLTWDLPDLSGIGSGIRTDDRDRFDALHGILEGHIRDLVQAIQGEPVALHAADGGPDGGAADKGGGT